jgi:N-acetylmuramoyl-L-alanine amidase
MASFGFSCLVNPSRFLCSFILAALTLVMTPDSTMAGQLSPLAPPPDWSALNAYQLTITRKEFSRLIEEVYSPDGGFWNYARIDDDKLVVFSDPAKTLPLFTLHFAPTDAACAPLPYSYKTQAVSSDPTRPLKGIRIALDPGHIGGDWAQLEARYFKLGDDPPVEEATLNMITCERLAERLQADGADVVWAKHDYEPVTPLRPDSLHREAIAALALNPETTQHKSGAAFIKRMIDNQAALLFYRVAEIRARAERVNQLHPDLTICVHYNADDWGNPDKPTLTEHSRLVIFVNGAYEKSELAHDDFMHDMLRKLLDRTAVQEERGCALVGQEMLDTLKYPPESYPGSYFAHHVTDVASVYARDLLANRLYHGPVIYCEGPYMNARDAYYRIIAGDYLGVRTIQGQSVASIYREYAAAVERGVLKYFGVK